MINRSDVENVYNINPFVGQRSIEEGLDLGIDFVDILEWAIEQVEPGGELLLEKFGGRASSAIWISGFRTGFFIGLGSEGGEIQQ